MTAELKRCPDCGGIVPVGAPGCVPCLLSLAESFVPEVTEAPSDASNARAEKMPLRTIGDYELLGEIGRGGMGVVYRARQRSLNRTVAVKLILAGEFASETVVARFREEAELIASLNHPNIVPIYDIGEHQGWHFFSMKLIEGMTLAQLVEERPMGFAKGKGKEKRGRVVAQRDLKQGDQSLVTSTPTDLGLELDLRGRVELMAAVCRAVHFAHQNGIIHRDLSPENILVDREGNPWVTDFGMARFVNADRRLTVTNAILGKPDFISPEQADPRGAAVLRLTTASDIFSCGAILYHLLTGQRPFAAETPLSTLERIRDHHPISPRSINPEIDRDLETIVFKCLLKNPSERYASASALADDLDRWRRGEPILARPLNALEASWKWMRRHPTKAALLGLGIMAFLGPLITTFALYLFIFPQHAKTHPIIGHDTSIGGFTLPFDDANPTRVTLNFDTKFFNWNPGPVRIYFTNVPPEQLEWFATRECQVMADIPGADDQARSVSVRHGDTFTIAPPEWRDRAYYLAPIGDWKGEVAGRATPDSRLCIVFLNGAPAKP